MLPAGRTHPVFRLYLSLRSGRGLPLSRLPLVAGVGPAAILYNSGRKYKYRLCCPMYIQTVFIIESKIARFC